MKFAYSTGIFRLRPLSDAIDSIARAGFCAIEVIAERPHAFPEDMTAGNIATLNQSLEQRKIKISNLSAFGGCITGEHHSPSWIEEDWQPRETRIRYTLDCMRMAAAMGIPYVTTGAAGIIPSTMNRRDAVRLFMANMERVFPVAKRLGVKLLIQPGPDLLLETSDHVLEFLNEVSFNESLGINFDGGHFFCAGEDPCESWEKLKKHTCHVHLGDVPADRKHHHVQLGEGATDIPAFLRCVEESGYAGYVTIHLDSYDQGPEEIVLASAGYLREKGFLPGAAEPCV